MGVEFVRSCFTGFWRFFYSQPKVITKGRYVFISDKAPHVPFFHNYGSDFWREGDLIVPNGGSTSRPLGHDRKLPWQWSNGRTPKPMPPEIPVGTKAQFEAPEIFPIVPAPVLQGGFDLRCAHKCVPPIGAYICDLFDLAINDCALLLVLEVLQVALSEFDHPRFEAIAKGLLGNNAGFYYDDGNADFPPFAIVHNPKNTLVVHCGTNSPNQWLSQIGAASLGPTDYGLYSSIPVWRSVSDRVFAALNGLGLSPLTRTLLFGHSLGAAGLCNLAARWIYANPKAPLRLITTGSPKPGDVRLQNLLNLLDRIHLTTREDIITRVPPSNAMKAALQTAFPFLPDALFGSFEPFPRYLYLGAGGEWVEDVYTDLDAFTLVNVITGWWIQGIIEAGLAHFGTFYVTRIREHCPCPEKPFDNAFYILMFGTSDCFEGGLLLGGGSADNSRPTGLALNGTGDLARHYVLEGTVGMVIAGGMEAKNLTSNFKLSGPSSSFGEPAGLRFSGSNDLPAAGVGMLLGGAGDLAMRYALSGQFDLKLNGASDRTNGSAALNLDGAGALVISSGVFGLVIDGAGLVKTGVFPSALTLDGAGDLIQANTPVPGTSCGTSPTITLGVVYKYHMASSPADQWFMFPASASTTYFVQIRKLQSEYPTATVYSGPDCAHLTTAFSLNSLSQCNTLAPGSGNNVYIRVFGSLLSTDLYTLLCGIGSCPP